MYKQFYIKRTWKRLVSLVLTVCMLVSMVPAFAAESGNTGYSIASYNYNFHKISIWRSRGANPNDWTDRHKGADITTLTDFKFTTAGDPDELYPNSVALTDPWHYVNSSGLSILGYSDANYGVAMGFNSGNVSFKIRVGLDGLYDAVQEHCVSTAGGTVKVYLAPGNDAANARDSKYLLGEIDTYATVFSKAIASPFGSIRLSAGDYILSYEMTGKNSAITSDAYFGFSAFKLNGKVPKIYNYNFFKLGYWRSRGADPNDWVDRHKGIDVRSITDFKYTTAGDPAEIHPNSTAKTDPWYYIADSGYSILAHGDANCGVFMGYGKGWSSFGIRVPTDGIYQAISQNAILTIGGIVRIYVAPMSDLANAHAEKYSVGCIDSYGTVSVATKQTPLRTLNLAAGDYVLSYEVIGNNPSITDSYGFYLSSFMLKEVNNIPTMSINTSTPRPFNPGITVSTPLSATGNSGYIDDLYYADINVSSKNPDIASAVVVSNESKTAKELHITGISPGSTEIDLTALVDGTAVATTSVAITIKSPILDKITLSLERDSINITEDGLPLTISGTDTDGDAVVLKPENYTFSVSEPGIVAISEDGFVKPVKVGKTTITINVSLSGVEKSASFTVTVERGKIASTYYTADMVQAARDNIAKYPWAKSISDSVVATAQKYVDNDELLWQSVSTQGLPRSATVGYRNDPNNYTCRYCGTDLRAKYGSYPWIIDPIGDPWKIQCPDCKRRFPSNDFESYYKAGLDEHGNFNYEKAKRDGQAYLKNVLYPEMGEGWGVDDGFGYKPGNTVIGTDGIAVEECHSYIAYYTHWGLWYGTGLIPLALSYLSHAYIYTGDAKYGRAGAILIDRVADVYPDMNLRPYQPRFFNSDFGAPGGKAVGRIWETGLAEDLAKAYDAFYPAMNDPYVVNFLSGKATQFNLTNTKSTSALIRKNCEDGILHEIFKACKSCDIYGNFGMHQSTLLTAAVVLDRMPETKEMIDWVFRSGYRIGYDEVTGGNLLAQLYTTINRDGHGNEAAPGYNALWIWKLQDLAKALAGYPGYTEGDLYNNPKFVKMMTSLFPLTLARSATAQIGDTGSTGNLGYSFRTAYLISAFQNTQDIKIAQMLYHLNGNKVTGLGEGDIFMKDIEGFQKQIQDIINIHGEYDFDRSEQVAGYGFSVLRGGSYYPSVEASKVSNMQRDFWMYYGIGTGHGHFDALNLGIEAYGLNMAPELGYPETTDTNDRNINWVDTTVTHNTVMVNDKPQTPLGINGDPLHFDDSGIVKVMDADVPEAYAEASKYRRTVVMIDASDEVSYGVDFFRIKGGNEHLYLFHSQSDEISGTQNINLTAQGTGSYAGPDVPYGTTGHKNGFTWLKDVRRDSNPDTGEFSVDFKVKDFRSVLPAEQSSNLHLRMSMLNDFKLSDVSIAKGVPPQHNNNPESLEFVLARRSGTNLDTLFTTVYEPYKNDRYIASMEQVPVVRADGAAHDANDIVKAVKVTLKNGRVDYVVYAANNQTEYIVDNLFPFRGFVGVYMVKNGKVACSYMNDGDKIGNLTGTAAYTGTVTDFTKESSFSNNITVTFNEAIDPENIKDKFIYITNDGSQNAAYPIKNVTAVGGNSYVLDIGDSTLIRGLVSASAYEQGFIYNITQGQSCRIPLSTLSNSAPVFTPVADKSIKAGSVLALAVNAGSPSGMRIKYSSVALPRGAIFIPLTGRLIWIPDSKQQGQHHIAIKASDGITESTLHFKINVLSNTGGHCEIVNHIMNKIHEILDKLHQSKELM